MPDELDLTSLMGKGPQPGEDLLPEAAEERPAAGESKSTPHGVIAFLMLGGCRPPQPCSWTRP
jgi:hypothetical protein